jgi:hypothetical protein
MHTNPTTSLQLPAPIATYFASEAVDPEAVARCFTENAVVADEHHEHRGRAAIAAWNADVVAKYGMTTEVLAADVEGGRTIVRAKVSGEFPGSPIELRFCFALEGSLITRLEIAP